MNPTSIGQAGLSKSIDKTIAFGTRLKIGPPKMLGNRCEPWVTTDFVLGMLSPDRAHAAQRYVEFMGQCETDNRQSGLDRLIDDACRNFRVTRADIVSVDRRRKLSVKSARSVRN